MALVIHFLCIFRSQWWTEKTQILYRFGWPRHPSFCQWRLSNRTTIFKSIVQRDILLFTHVHNNQQKTKQNINWCKERDCVMNYLYYCTDSYKSSLFLPFSFLFPFPFSPFPFSPFFPLLFFSPFLSFPLLSFLFPFISLNVLQVREAPMEIIWEKAITIWKARHILYFAQFEKCVFSPSILQINWDRIL